MEVPYVLVQVLMYTIITYAMVGFEWTAAKFFWYFYVTYFGVIMFTYYGMMMVALTPNATLVTICASFFYSLFNLFSGFLITKPVRPSPQSYAYFLNFSCSACSSKNRGKATLFLVVPYHQVVALWVQSKNQFLYFIITSG